MTSTCARPAAGPPQPLLLGAHQLAHLRAVAEGVPVRDAAVRYLAHDPHDGAVALRRAHQAIVDRARLLARRQGERRWRLLGLVLRLAPPASLPPPLDDWAAAQGLQDFSHAEQLALHAEAFGSDRRARRDQRLRLEQLQLLKALARQAVQAAAPAHPLEAWFPEPLARLLVYAGVSTLADLQARVQAGGCWWRGLPRVGEVKAARILQHLALLLPQPVPPQSAHRQALHQRGRQLAAAVAHAAAPAGVQMPAATLAGPGSAAAHLDATEALPATGARAERPALPPAAGTPGFDLSGPALVRRDMAADVQAVRAWLQARAGSDATARAYRREMGRFLLFLEQRGRTLAQCKADDCLAYMALLQNVPADWIGPRSAPLSDAAWSPFTGPLSHRSQAQAVVVVASCLRWLVAAGYLAANPWALVNRRTGDDRQADMLASRAFEPAHWDAILGRLEALAQQQPAAERMVFLLRFLEASGLRAAELLGSRLADLRQADGRLLLQVHGKGSRNRLLPMTGQAQRALSRYLAARGLHPEPLHNPPALPLLASLADPQVPLGYRTLYGSMKGWLRKAIDACDLAPHDRVQALRASPHWLRHTCGTRAVERGVPLDVVGQLLGHADPRTTARYTRAQLKRMGDALEQAFG